MTEISDTEAAEVLWSSDDEGRAANQAAWEAAKRLDLLKNLDRADIGALVWAAHQAAEEVRTGQGGEEAVGLTCQHSWTILDAQEVPPPPTFIGKPMPRTAVLTRCANCGEPATRVLEGTWTRETFAAAPVDGA